jgi:cell division protein FtsQ
MMQDREREAPQQPNPLSASVDLGAGIVASAALHDLLSHFNSLAPDMPRLLTPAPRSAPPPTKRKPTAGGKPAARRKPAPRHRLRPGTRRGLRIAGAVALGLSAVIAISNAWPAIQQKTFAWTAAHGLAVQDILVEGRYHTDTQAVLAAIAIQPGESLLTLSPRATRERLLEIAWIESAVVERRWPGTVYVRLIERIPVALWERNGSFTLVDKTGVLIGPKPEGQFDRLMVLSGEGAPEQALNLLAMLARHEDLRKQIVAAAWVGSRRWNLYLANGIEIYLPEQDPHLAFDRIAHVEAEQKLLSRPIKRIDLRLADRMVIKPQSAPVAAAGPARAARR